MTSQTRATLKGYFNTNDQPTEAQFADLIDSGLNLADETNWTLGSGVDEYALVYDHDTARFVLRAPFDGTPYALLAGRAGGQTLYGGTAANDDITIHGTSDGTRATSYVLLQPTAGNVGIGTTAPGAKLQIGASSGGSGVLPTNAMMWISSAGGNSSTVPAGRFDISMVDANPDYSTYIGTLNVDYGSTPAIGVLGTRNAALDFPTLYLKSGNVGIGTTAPATALHVVGAATITAGIRPAADSTTALQLQNVAGASVLNVDTTNGYVGIGTAAPWAPLDVQTNAGSTETLRLTSSAGAYWNLLSVYADTNPDLIFKANNIEKIRFDVNGNINTIGVYKVDGVQVLSNRVIDARCADVANSGDATTDGLIDALRDAMVAHGLIAASA